MIFLTTLFMPLGTLGPARWAEFQFCIEKNLENPLVERFFILWEGPPCNAQFLKHPKIRLRPWHRRPRYEDFMGIIDREVEPGKVVAVLNTDVWCDSTLIYANDIYEGDIYGITRLNWEPGLRPSQCQLQGDGTQGSQDIWIWRAPLKKFPADIMLGVIGCDSYFTQHAIDAGIRVFNPCKTIHVMHYHSVGVRNDQPEGLRYWNAPGYRGATVMPCTVAEIKSIRRNV